MKHSSYLFAVVLSAFAALLGAAAVRACPFCSASSQTLSEEMAANDLALIVRMTEAPKKDEFTGTAKFEILKVLKGDEHLGGAKTVETTFFGDGSGEIKEGKFFLTGGVVPNLTYNLPVPISERGEEYIRNLPELPEKGPERLGFFLNYLEDKDPIIAQDAFDEWAKAPFAEMVNAKDKLDREQILAWIHDLDIVASHRRLYLSMLSLCGTKDDLPMLEEMIRSKDRREKAGLDVMISTYLTLRGEDGMELVEDLFLKNKDAEYADTYAAVMAIRIHGQEIKAVPRQRLLEGLRYMLDRPDLADLVIVDLARWEDWSATDRLVDLFKNAEDGTSWVRVPVVNFLQTCAKQDSDAGRKAQAALVELEKIDPEAIKQATSLSAFGALAQPAKRPENKDEIKEDDRETPDAGSENGSKESANGSGETPADGDSKPNPDEEGKTTAPPVATAAATENLAAKDGSRASPDGAAENQPREKETAPPDDENVGEDREEIPLESSAVKPAGKPFSPPLTSRQIVAALIGGAVVLFGLMWLILVAGGKGTTG